MNTDSVPFPEFFGRVKADLKTALKAIEDHCRVLREKIRVKRRDLLEDAETLSEHASLALNLVNNTFSPDQIGSRKEALSHFRHELVNHLFVITEYSSELKGEIENPAEFPEIDRIYSLGKYLDHLLHENLSESSLEKARRLDSPLPAETGPAEVEVFGDASTFRDATLLIADDDEGIRNVLSRKFQKLEAGARILTAADGSETLHLVESEDPDIVLLDVVMPGVSGLEVLKTLRTRYPMTQLPIIMSTGRKETSEIVEAFRLGANDYITKPLDFPVAAARVLTQLQLKRAMEEIAKRNLFIRSTLGRFLTDSVVDKVLNDPHSLAFEGEKREVTILMSDLRGFTSLSERLSPEQVVEILNLYLSAMIPIIDQFEGTIDEIIGDALLVLFGAPVGREDDPERAVACALAMQSAMKSVNRQLLAKGLPEIEMGIGLNTGEVVVGTLGTMDRSKYGVVGRHVNFAARVESCTLGGQVLISENTRCRIRVPIDLEQGFEVRAKGFENPITLYEVNGIGGKYAVSLPRRKLQPVPLRTPVPIEFTVLEGKVEGTKKVPGRITAFSGKTAVVFCDSPAPAPLSNLRIHFPEPCDERLHGDAYGKVDFRSERVEPGRFTLHFTDIPNAARRVLNEWRER